MSSLTKDEAAIKETLIVSTGRIEKPLILHYRKIKTYLEMINPVAQIDFFVFKNTGRVD